jgi:uncharacterized membrane protein
MFWKPYLATLVAFLIVDAIWIGVVVRDLYERALGDWMRSSPGVVAAGAFYLAYAAGIVYLAIQPALLAGSARTAVVNAAVLGGLAYGTFTVTNFAVLERWNLTLLVSDVLWGIAITAFSAWIGYQAGRY